MDRREGKSLGNCEVDGTYSLKTGTVKLYS